MLPYNNEAMNLALLMLISLSGAFLIAAIAITGWTLGSKLYNTLTYKYKINKLSKKYILGTKYIVLFTKNNRAAIGTIAGLSLEGVRLRLEDLSDGEIIETWIKFEFFNKYFRPLSEFEKTLYLDN